MTQKQTGYKFLRARIAHQCECGYCAEQIPKGGIAVTDILLDNTKSFTGAEYKAYFIPNHYPSHFLANDAERAEFNQALNKRMARR